VHRVDVEGNPVLNTRPDRRNNPIQFLRAAALVEAVSFLILVGVAMPLKYFAGIPLAVTVAGWIHGVLFAAFVASLAQTTVVARWPLARAALVFVAALLPFGPIVIDGRMRAYAREFRAVSRSGGNS
jgi:integral membrane protein